MAKELTATQAGLFHFIESHIIEHGIAPTFEEMRIAAGWASKSRVFRVLEDLEARGYIRRGRLRARAIAIVTPANHCPHCPHCQRRRAAELRQIPNIAPLQPVTHQEDSPHGSNQRREGAQNQNRP